jgi:DNA-binding MarR family transcriptional regulator
LQAELPGSDSSDDSVTLSARDAREIARLLALLLQPGGAEPALPDWILAASHPVASPRHDPERAILVARAKAELAVRRRRMKFFAPVLFGEIGWEMLLVLYYSDFAGARQTVGRLVESIAAPSTTALRWLDYLEKEALVRRAPHPTDRRITFVILLEKGRSLLDRYFGEGAEPSNPT